jgi:glycosyltransferase involved in cell wall biosynthesis
LLTSPGLAGRVLTLGERRDVPRLLGAMDVFCQSSFSEGFPNALLEAAVAGLPSVATDVGASSEIAGSGAVLVPPRDPVALAAALGRLARMGAERRSLGDAARAHAIERYSLNGVVATYSTLLETISRPAAERRRVAAGAP